MSFIIYFWGVIFIMVGILVIYMGMGEGAKKLKLKIVKNIEKQVGVLQGLMKIKVEVAADSFCTKLLIGGIITILIGVSAVLGRIFS